MNKIIHAIMKHGLKSLPLRQLVRLKGARPLCFFYHTVFSEPPAYFSQLYPVQNVSDFERDIDVLLSYFHPISVEDLLRSNRGACLPRHSFFLSFDDGYRELAETVAPILKRKGVPATFFLCSNFVDNGSWFWEDQLGLLKARLAGCQSVAVRREFNNTLAARDQAWTAMEKAHVPNFSLINALGKVLEINWSEELDQFQPYLTSHQVEGLLADGFGIGAHGIDHVLLDAFSQERQLQQVRESCDLIAERFSLPYRAFAFPYTESGIAQSTLEKLRSDNVADCLFGTRGLIEDEFQPFVHQRLWCERPRVRLEDHLREHIVAKSLRQWQSLDRVTRKQKCLT